jgi:hypothetical protein
MVSCRQRELPLRHRQNHAAERLIKRGFLTKVEVDATFSPLDWIVVVITPENVEALREAQAAG